MPAATLQPGLRHEFSYRVPPEMTKVDGPLLEFAVQSHDGIDTIARGTHRRAIVDAAKFSARAAAKVPGTAS